MLQPRQRHRRSSSEWIRRWYGLDGTFSSHGRRHEGGEAALEGASPHRVDHWFISPENVPAGFEMSRPYAAATVEYTRRQTVRGDHRVLTRDRDGEGTVAPNGLTGDAESPYVEEIRADEISRIPREKGVL